jgi:hypothetical protein
MHRGIASAQNVEFIRCHALRLIITEILDSELVDSLPDERTGSFVL